MPVDRHADPLELLRADPASTGLMLDYDGTLSEIVDRPDRAHPAEGAKELLEQLGRTYALVALVSGRSASQLLDWLGDGVEIWGLHGAERTEGGRVVLSERARPFEALMRRVYADARTAFGELAPSGALLEDKGVMLTLHYRRAPDPEVREALRALAARLAAAHGLVVAEGKMSFELRPPVAFTKADVVRDLPGRLGLRTVAFAGDDVVDLPAFDALDELAAGGLTVVRIAVDSDEAPAELIERADVVVRGPEGMIAMLRRLLDV